MADVVGLLIKAIVALVVLDILLEVLKMIFAATPTFGTLVVFAAVVAIAFGLVVWLRKSI